jgi:hypothetical protein
VRDVSDSLVDLEARRDDKEPDVDDYLDSIDKCRMLLSTVQRVENKVAQFS